MYLKINNGFNNFHYYKPTWPNLNWNWNLHWHEYRTKGKFLYISKSPLFCIVHLKVNLMFPFAKHRMQNIHVSFSKWLTVKNDCRFIIAQKVSHFINTGAEWVLFPRVGWSDTDKILLRSQVRTAKKYIFISRVPFFMITSCFEGNMKRTVFGGSTLGS